MNYTEEMDNMQALEEILEEISEVEKEYVTGHKRP